jgi:uncharacterized membrane protein
MMYSAGLIFLGILLIILGAFLIKRLNKSFSS